MQLLASMTVTNTSCHDWLFLHVSVITISNEFLQIKKDLFKLNLFPRDNTVTYLEAKQESVQALMTYGTQTPHPSDFKLLHLKWQSLNHSQVS